MDNNIFVSDNLIPQDLQNFYTNIIYGKLDNSEIFPLVDFKVKYEPTAKDEYNEPISFMHILKSNAELSNHLANFSQIPQIVCAHLNLNLQDILYARIFLTIPYCTNQEYHNPHIDLPYFHYNLIYYVNDATGDTVLFDDSNNIIKKITPKKGRVVLFPGNILHGAGIPKEKSRCIINFNLLF